MDHELFKRLIENLLSVNVLYINNKGDSSLKTFEENYCFHNVLQPMFTAEALTFLLASSREGVIYEIVDSLGICLSFFIFGGGSYIVGPYVNNEFSEKKLASLLIENNLSSSNMVTLRLYYTSLPILYINQVQETVISCMAAFSPDTIPYTYRRLIGFIGEKNQDTKIAESEDMDYSEIYKRYDAERRFLSMIRSGDVENITVAYDAMVKNVIGSEFLRNSLSYSERASYFAIIRALARKAAEESGLSVITIDSITQHYVQLADLGRSKGNTNDYIQNMIVELTTAVRNYRKNYGEYDYSIRKAIEYIELHLSQEITLDKLSEISNTSAPYLSKLFKKETGITITGFIAKERCKKAAALLEDSTLPIQDISNFVGYPDNNYFVKVFKKVYGKTPSEYRKALQNPL